MKWLKSSFSGGGDGNTCLELAAGQSGTLLRESDEPGTVLEADPRALSGLLGHIKQGGPGAVCPGP